MIFVEVVHKDGCVAGGHARELSQVADGNACSVPAVHEEHVALHARVARDEFRDGLLRWTLYKLKAASK